jgi:hypothetical protein
VLGQRGDAGIGVLVTVRVATTRIGYEMRLVNRVTASRAARVKIFEAGCFGFL